MVEAASAPGGKTTVTEKRWNDHWQVRWMTWTLGLCAMTLLAGGGWIVRSAIAADSKNSQQDIQIQTTNENLKDFREEQRQANRRIEEKLDLLRNSK